MLKKGSRRGRRRGDGRGEEEKTYVVVGLVGAVEGKREVVGLGGGCAKRATLVGRTRRRAEEEGSALMTWRRKETSVRYAKVKASNENVR